MNIYAIIIRLLLAVVIGGSIGYERESNNRPAGFRTHILVTLGATIISLIQLQMLEESIKLMEENPTLANAMKIDMGRLGAQVVSGIGFLGAGTILHQKGSIKGLTTAASLWVVGCLGLAIGQGYYTIGILGGVSVVLILVTLKKFEARFILSNELVKIYMEYKSKNQMISFMEEYFTATGIKIKNIEFYMKDASREFSERSIESCLMTIKLPKSYNLDELILKCSKNENIIKINEIKD
jgi:putative Mg2+ transporter-C (MgtC) family protein